MSGNKKTLVLGASAKYDRYSNHAVRLLKKNNHEVVPVGFENAEIEGISIKTGTPAEKNIHTVSLYLNPTRQKAYYDYILSLKPMRIIFNPGTENPELEKLAERNGIEALEACTLVLLTIGTF